MQPPSPSAGRLPDAQARTTAAQRLAEGIAHHNAGRLAEAEAAYRAVLAVVPQQPDALHLMGVIALQVGKPEPAAALIGEAIRFDAGKAVYFSNLGTALRRLGRLAEAEAAQRRAIGLDAGFTDALSNLANVLMDRDAHAEAADTLARLAALRPLTADQSLQHARALILAGRLEEAVDLLDALRRRSPETAGAYVNLGVALKKLGRGAAAEAAYRRGLTLCPDDAGMLSNRGVMLHEGGHPDRAVVCLRRAIRVDPASGDARINLCLALTALNAVDEAVAAGRDALLHRPGSADAHTALGCALLVRGDLAEGFAEYEWRLRMAEFTSPRRSFPQPVWDGEPLDGRTLLIHDEQGVGDAIQFARYAPLIRARMGGRVIVECNTQLTRLLGGLAGIDGVYGRFSPLPPFDTHVTMLSVPHRLGTRLDDVPAAVPYLSAEPALVQRWGERLAGLAGQGGLRVGIVWAGSPGHRNDRNRSLPLAAFAPLAAVPGVTLVSVQKGPASEQIGRRPAGMAVVDLGPEIGDFADTAAIAMHLDLLVAVDTSVVHLAGALGRPVWTLLPYAPDWRWMLARTDTPWYPTMRLFRQETPGVWDPVLARVAAALAREAAGRGP